MINSGILDIVIGLVFIYLLYSLLATIIQEIIASNFEFRSKFLERAIFRMLEDENQFSSRFKRMLYLFRKSNNTGKKNLLSFEFYQHPLIKFLGEGNMCGKPAYLSRETFSKVMIDLLRGKEFKPGDDVKIFIQKALDEKTTSWGNTKISEDTLSYIKSIWADADGNETEFKGHLECWFDETMDRASGWFKMQTQFVLFFVGLAIAIVFNVDTIKIVNKLEKDPKLRELIVQQAQAFDETHQNLDKELVKQEAEYKIVTNQYTKVQLNSNDSLQKKQWEDSLQLESYRTTQTKRDSLFRRAELILQDDIKKSNNILGSGPFSYGSITDLKTFLCTLFGWTVTALAISLGAPFWFDLLNKMMRLRGSVATPTSDDKEKKQG